MTLIERIITDFICENLFNQRNLRAIFWFLEFLNQE